MQPTAIVGTAPAHTHTNTNTCNANKISHFENRATPSTVVQRIGIERQKKVTKSN